MLPEPVTKVAAGHHHTLFLTESGNVWACGRNSRGQLGLGSKAGASATIPQRLEALTGLCACMHKCVCNLRACTRVLHISRSSCTWCRALTYHAYIGASYQCTNILLYQAACLQHHAFMSNLLATACMVLRSCIAHTSKLLLHNKQSLTHYPNLWADKLLLTEAFQQQMKLLIELDNACVLLFLNIHTLLTQVSTL